MKSRTTSPVAGVDDGGVEVVDEDQDAGSVVVASDADVVQASAPTESTKPHLFLLGGERRPR